MGEENDETAIDDKVPFRFELTSIDIDHITDGCKDVEADPQWQYDVDLNKTWRISQPTSQRKECVSEKQQVFEEALHEFPNRSDGLRRDYSSARRWELHSSRTVRRELLNRQPLMLKRSQLRASVAWSCPSSRSPRLHLNCCSGRVVDYGDPEVNFLISGSGSAVTRSSPLFRRTPERFESRVGRVTFVHPFLDQTAGNVPRLPLKRTQSVLWGSAP